MKFAVSTVFVALIALTSAVAIEEPGMTAIRRNVLILERAGANAGRPVATGNCCIANTSKKEDVCTTAAGAAGKCVPEGAQVNCNGALNCIAASQLKCNANVLENGRPTCRRSLEEDDDEDDE